MNNKNLFTELEQVLRMESSYCTEDGVLLKNAIVEAALALRPELIAKLLTHDGLKRNFLTEVEDVLVFDKVKFQKFVMNKRFLPDSYTSFKNKVGLTNEDGDFLSESREVVLSWPYKDCVLEGGQTKEDAKRNEVFWNEILAPDEINRLTEPKVLTNFKRYDADGEHEVDSISMEDNLIIKGNNLLALHSLKKKYAGKVKLIYIDPPYNTGSDSFGYNDNFNHSTWLTFMQNRLEAARRLLKDDGVIFVQSDDHEQAYLKVLLDQIFGKDNFINVITVKTKIGGVSGSSEGKSFKDATEFISVYAKYKGGISFNNVGQLTLLLDYIQAYIEEGKSWKYTSVITSLSGKKFIKEVNGYKFYSYDNFESQSVSKFALSNGITTSDVYEKFNSKIFRTTNAQSSVRQIVLDNTDDLDNEIVSVVYVPTKGKNKGTEIEIFYKDSNRNMLMFLSDYVEVVGEKSFYREKVNTLWDDILYNNISKEGAVDFPNGKKPESLIQRIIELSTDEGDIVLDFFGGCGTTAAVAHKMKRRYISMEQMESQISLITSRLSNVINGDTTGISKSANWQGGGSFVYCELAKANQQFADDIEQASSSEELATIWEQMQETGFLSWKVSPKEIDANAEDFTALAIEDQKRFLIECLDKNLLYVPYPEIDNAEFGISENDKKINNQFYQTK